MKKLNKKAFTLVEMLIVIVIIGILIAALLPRLQGAQGRARDVSRRNSINQLGTAIAAYMNDHGALPAAGATGVDVFASKLLDDGIITTIPTDPQLTNTVKVGASESKTGNFLFIPLKRNGIDNRAFALVAAVETVGGANWVSTGTTVGNLNGADIVTTILCSNLTK
jgi:prepilin-type N-terminal cleavage/methylation domain-containing protein